MSPHVPAGPRPGRGARRLVLAAALITVLGVVVGGPVGDLALVVALAALTTATVVMMRAHWVAAGDAGLPPPAPVDVQVALRRLRGEHIAAVDAALDAGRHDLARALVVAHQEESRRLLEGIATRPLG